MKSFNEIMDRNHIYLQLLDDMRYTNCWKRHRIIQELWVKINTLNWVTS